jgi:hypothetical protein
MRTALSLALILLAVALAPKFARALDRSRLGRGMLWAYASLLVTVVIFAVLLLGAFGIRALFQF